MIYCPFLISLTTMDIFFSAYFVWRLISLLELYICSDLVGPPSLCFQTRCSMINLSFVLEFM